MAQKKKSGLGKGLDALFMDNSIEDFNGQTVMLKLYEIEPNKNQPRKNFDQQALEELADSILEHGIIQPLIVCPLPEGGYQIIAGERRWRAARMAGLTEVPVLIKEIPDSQVMELALVENLQREDLNPIEEAEGLRMLIETYGLTQEETARRVGKSRSAVANTTRLLTLPQNVVDKVRQGALTAGHAKALLGLSDESKIKELAKEIEKKGLSVRDTEKLVKYILKDDKSKEKKDTKKRDVFYDEVELAVSDVIGRKAKVTVNSAGKGSLVIDFYSKDDLAQLAMVFTGG